MILNWFKKSYPWNNKREEYPAFLLPTKENKPTYTKSDYSEYYQTNPIAFKCVDLIASALSTVNINVTNINNGEVIENHPLVPILKRPNQRKSGSGFLHQWATYHLVYGESYIKKAVSSRREIIELNLTNPLNVTIEDRGWEYPEAYIVNTGNTQIRYEVDPISGYTYPRELQGIGETSLYQIANSDVDNSFNGLSKMAVAAYAIDSFTFGMSWNRNLLQNQAKPSLALEAPDKAWLSIEQKQALTEMLKRYEGHENSSKTMVLEGGMQAKQLSLNPSDMDFATLLDKMSLYISGSFGVPYQLVVPEGTTFNNMAEARAILYRETVLPLLTKMLEGLSIFLSREYPGIWLEFDETSINALKIEKMAEIEGMTKATGNNLLSIDEGRKELGYEPRGGLADDIFIRQGQTPLEMAGEINEPDPDNINGNEEDTDEEGSNDIGEDEQTSSDERAQLQV